MSFPIESSKRLENATEYLRKIPAPLSFGVKFLDLATDGIFADDLIVLTANTGVGKTECVTQIAQHNVLQNKRVHFFALEAHVNEIELRLKFKMLSQAFFICEKNWRDLADVPDYQRWIAGKQKHVFEKFEPEVNELFAKTYNTLFTYYRDDSFSIDTFESQMARIGDATDLVIIDHLHFFDLASENEARDLKKTLMEIKKIVAFYRKPCILVVHVRKQDKRLRALLPDAEELHGSSEIAKIATRIIAVGPAFDQKNEIPYVLPTYFKLQKNRWSGTRCRNVGLCYFDAQRNAYLENFKVGEFQNSGTEFVELSEWDWPRWAKL